MNPVQRSKIRRMGQGVSSSSQHQSSSGGHGRLEEDGCKGRCQEPQSRGVPRAFRHRTSSDYKYGEASPAVGRIQEFYACRL